MHSTPANYPVSKIVAKLKDAEQDFEFYPTTDRMIKLVLDDVDGSDELYEQLGRSVYGRFEQKNFLDVGAGNGAFLRAAKERFEGADLLAIEKSQLLVSGLVSFAKVIGTDFHAQSFLSKQVQVLFCNPPYLEYEAWTSRLIRECPATVMYLIIPRRWKSSDQIKAAIEFREAEVRVVGSDDFLEADRRSRAKVDILCITPNGDRGEENDLFTRFFLEQFGNLREKMEQSETHEKKNQDERRQGLVEREGLVGALVALYDCEMERLRSNYVKAVSLDASLLKELNLDITTIVNTLKEKIDALKSGYWEELFSNLDTVTNRLTSKNRRMLLDTIGGFKAVDFTRENIYAVLLWIIEHANNYVNSQIMDVFNTMLSKANMTNYKSNQKVYGEGKYRYNEEKPTHVSLDFRIVLEGYKGISTTYSGQKLSDSGRDFVADLLCVANLLGFPASADHDEWRAGRSKLYKGLDGQAVAEFKAFKNGNMHVRMSQRLTLALNVAMGKLCGWLRDHNEAKAEFGESAAALGDDIEQIYARDLHLTPKMLNLPGPTRMSA